MNSPAVQSPEGGDKPAPFGVVPRMVFAATIVVTPAYYLAIVYWIPSETATLWHATNGPFWIEGGLWMYGIGFVKFLLAISLCNQALRQLMNKTMTSSAAIIAVLALPCVVVVEAFMIPFMAGDGDAPLAAGDAWRLVVGQWLLGAKIVLTAITCVLIAYRWYRMPSPTEESR